MNTTNVETREFGFQTSEASRTPTPIQNQTKTLPPLLPLNKKQTPQIVSKAVNAVAVKPEPPNDENSTNPNTRQDEVKDPIDATVPAVTPPAVVQAPATCDSSQVSQQVLGSAAAPTEKEEKRTHPAPARKPKLRDPEFQRRLQRSKALVNRHADILRKSIMRKRALMEKKLALQIENEVQKERLKVCQVQPQQQPQPQPSKFASNSPSLATSNGSQLKTVPAVAKKVPPQGPVKTAQLKPPGQPANKKRAASNASPATNAPCPSSSPAKKRAHAVATPSTEDSTVYCICKRRYDPTKFMIGCDLCENWFHIACIGVSEAEAQRMDGWVCLDCTQKKSDAAVELFCICRTPYDESQFYIYCDNCQGWFHGRCVGVLQSEANNIDVYICPDCKIKTGADEESLKLLNKPLTKIDLDSLKKLLLAVRNHKQAWPFKEPVNRKQAPDYYKVIKNPMDLRTVEQNLTASKYTTLQQFVNDMTLIFDNCRYYNSKQSNFYSCADLLEAFFVQKMKLYKEALQRRM